MKCNLHGNEVLEYNQHERLELQHQFVSISVRGKNWGIVYDDERDVPTPISYFLRSEE